MPTYQYACTACDERLEAVQSFTDAPLTECPACSGRLRKVFSAVGVVFKGSGFYKTDSRSGSTAKDGATSDAKADSTSGGKGDGASSGTSGGKSDGASSGPPAATPAAASSGSTSSSAAPVSKSA